VVGFFSSGTLDSEDGEIGAAHPEVGFEAVGAEQASVGEVLRCNDDGDCAEKQGEAAPAELAGYDSGLHNEQRRCQRRDEADAAEGVSQYGAVHVDEKGYERGLVNIAPGKVIAAGNVVEFIAEVTVAVVEIDVEEKPGECDEPDDHHAPSQE